MPPINNNTPRIVAKDGGFTVDIPSGNIDTAKLAKVFADVLVLVGNKDGADGNFDQYALALAGLNGPLQKDPVEAENAAAAVLARAQKEFEPSRFKWQAGRAPKRYGDQLRDLAIALLRRIQSTPVSNASVRALQSDNLKALGSAYAMLDGVGKPSARSDERLGTVKVPQWTGSVWKDTYAKYRSYSFDTSAIDQFQHVDNVFEELAQQYAQGALPQEKLEETRTLVRDYADAIEGIEAAGLPEKTSTYRVKIRGWGK